MKSLFVVPLIWFSKVVGPVATLTVEDAELVNVATNEVTSVALGTVNAISVPVIVPDTVEVIPLWTSKLNAVISFADDKAATLLVTEVPVNVKPVLVMVTVYTWPFVAAFGRTIV